DAGLPVQGVTEIRKMTDAQVHVVTLDDSAQTERFPQHGQAVDPDSITSGGLGQQASPANADDSHGKTLPIEPQGRIQNDLFQPPLVKRGNLHQQVYPPPRGQAALLAAHLYLPADEEDATAGD